MRCRVVVVLAVTLLSLFSKKVLAVYEDQYKEYDWQISNFGPNVENVIFKVLILLFLFFYF